MHWTMFQELLRRISPCHHQDSHPTHLLPTGIRIRTDKKKGGNETETRFLASPQKERKLSPRNDKFQFEP